MAKPRVRCRICRIWLNCTVGATKVPDHNWLQTTEKCSGSGKAPAEHQGW